MTAEPIGSKYPDLPGFDKRNRELVYAMCDSGWTGRRTGNGHWLAKAPDAATKITVPSKDNAGRGLKNAHAMFMRWLKEHMASTVQEVWDAAVEEDDPMLKDILAESLVRKQATQITQERTEREYREAVEHVKKAISQGTIVVEPLVRPWMARKAPRKDGGVLYESEAVLERVWPTGETDYQCAFTGCEYVNDNPRGVAAHYGKAHTLKGEAEPASQDGRHKIDPTYTEPLSTRGYRPTQRLVDALATFLSEHSWDNTDELAVLMLEWAHYRDDIEHTTRDLAPLTDTDIVNKIRMIVGLPDQSAKIEQLQLDLIQARSEITRLKEEKAALRELLTED